MRFGAFNRDGRRLLVGAAGGARVLELAPDARPVADILAEARLLGVRQLDDRGVPVHLTHAEEMELFETWRAKQP